MFYYGLSFDLDRIINILRKPKLHGAIQTLASFWWIYQHAHRLWHQHFGTIFYVFMIPTWELIIEVLLGFFGVLISYLTCFQYIKIRYGYFFIGLLFLIGVIIIVFGGY